MKMLAPQFTCPVIHRRQNSDTLHVSFARLHRWGRRERKEKGRAGKRKEREKNLFHLRWRGELMWRQKDQKKKKKTLGKKF